MQTCRSKLTRETRPRVLEYLAAIMTALSLGACTSGPDFILPEAEPPIARFETDEENSLPVAPVPAPVPVAWWKLFNDPQLTDLQRRASAGNLTLQAATARIAQSRAQQGIIGAAAWPHLGFAADYAREANSRNGPNAALGAPSSAHNMWQADFDASWEIDLWGHTARMREGASAATQASLFARESIRVSLAAEVARNYLELRGVQTQLDIAAQNLDIAKHTVALTESRVRNGVATRFDTASALAQQASTEALIPTLAHRRDALLNALALLLGEPPRKLNDTLAATLPLPVLPARIPVGLPSELARRRPDIREAEARLHQATAAIGVAQADFYPRISLTGSLGLQAFNRNDMGNWSSRRFTVGPTLYLPIFEGGRLKSTLALTEAQQQKAAIDYQQKVLTAWHEIDNALSAFRAEQNRNRALQVAFDQNHAAFGVAQRAYRQGIGDYLSVLVAQRNLLNSQVSLAESTTTVCLTLVTVYKALGGGWHAGALLDDQGDAPVTSVAADEA